MDPHLLAQAPARLPREGVLGFGLAALVAVVGVATAAVWGVTGILDQTQAPADFSRADVPGEVSVVLTHVGPHVVYYEGADPTLPAGEVVVTGSDGSRLEVRPYALDLRYDVPGRPGAVGTAIGVFDADRTGAYLVGTRATVTEPHVQPADAQLAVGDDLAPATVRAIVLPALAALGSVVVAIALAVRTWARRNWRSHP